MHITSIETKENTLYKYEKTVCSIGEVVIDANLVYLLQYNLDLAKHRKIYAVRLLIHFKE